MLIFLCTYRRSLIKITVSGSDSFKFKQEDDKTGTYVCKKAYNIVIKIGCIINIG